MNPAARTSFRRSAVFLDRDGVLTSLRTEGGVQRPPSSLSELELMPGAAQACRSLRRLGYVLVMITNQPDVPRGRTQREAVDAINDVVASRLALDDVRVCYHDDPDECECRKPRPGMIIDAAQDLALNLRSSFVIGDRWRDVEAGRRAGCRTILLDGSPDEGLSCSPDFRARSLTEALRHIGPAPETVSVTSLSELRVEIFADGADEESIRALSADPLIKGFTTNPTLMRQAGVQDYEMFARRAVVLTAGRPLSLEVFDDEFDEMEEQALAIASWGSNVFVKIPITNTRGEPSYGLLRRLAKAGIQLNATAVFTLEQVRAAATALAAGPRAYISLFAGRIADTGRDPIPLVASAVQLLTPHPRIGLIWASPREVLNVFHADAAGCHVITMTRELLSKLHLVGKNLDGYSLETVRMFHDDAQRAGYRIATPTRGDPADATPRGRPFSRQPTRS